ncbi:helix-turn-helix transcriptional regulator [Agromyces sp. NPDC058110]|uniref:helix-turn-helix transcriptional regulator n=1 Tax=Agromyces sp. NPDC058110 TaxID=3346345 RepID=UPI0036DBE86D
MMGDNQIGELLRARRESLRPQDVGLPQGDRARRVPGLRREEVAVLAGISSEYYLRLEQGRERHPSAQVVAAIARALRFDRSTEDFLRLLVGLAPDRTVRPSTATADLTGFVEALSSTPAFAHDRMLTVIASNPLARAVSPSFTPGVNLVRDAFLDPALAALYLNRDEMRERMVAYLRAQAATPPADPALPALVDEMTRASAEFGALWARIEVKPASTGVNRLQHPQVGAFELRFERLCFAGSDDPVILIYHPEPGSPSEAAVERLRAGVAVAAASGQKPLASSQSTQTSAMSRQPASIVSE